MLLAVLVAWSACDRPAPFKIKDTSPKSDREAKWDPPQSYPEWAYDKQRLMKPAQDLQPEPRARPEDPPHYFTNKNLVPIRQPGNYKPEEVPRICVWVSDNNGFEWKKAGYFGQFEADFWFVTSKDGDYGIRFTGPGQEPAKIPVASPERVYHVDTTLPKVDVRVEPSQPQYTPGQKVVINWKATDYHLTDQPVAIGYAIDFTASQPQWTELQKDLAAEGSYSFQMPAGATDHSVIFRVAALDRAGNLGLGFSHVLQVVGSGERPESAGQSTPMASQTTPTGASGYGGMTSSSSTPTMGYISRSSSSSSNTTASAAGTSSTSTNYGTQSSTGTQTTPANSSSNYGSDELILVDSPDTTTPTRTDSMSRSGSTSTGNTIGSTSSHNTSGSSSHTSSINSSTDSTSTINSTGSTSTIGATGSNTSNTTGQKSTTAIDSSNSTADSSAIDMDSMIGQPVRPANTGQRSTNQTPAASPAPAINSTTNDGKSTTDDTTSMGNAPTTDNASITDSNKSTSSSIDGTSSDALGIGGAMLDFDVLFEAVPKTAPKSPASNGSASRSAARTTAGATEWTIPVGQMLTPPSTAKAESKEADQRTAQTSQPVDVKKTEKKATERKARPSGEPQVSAPRRSLVAPMPGTLADDEPSTTPRSWMRLDKSVAKDGRSVWVLPRPAFMGDAHGLFEMKYMSDSPEVANASTDVHTPSVSLDQFSGNDRTINADAAGLVAR